MYSEKMMQSVLQCCRLLICVPICLLVRKVPKSEEDEGCRLLSPASDDAPIEAPVRKNTVNMVLLFLAAMLYDSAVCGAIEILSVFVVKSPLSWTATQVTWNIR